MKISHGKRLYPIQFQNSSTKGAPVPMSLKTQEIAVVRAFRETNLPCSKVVLPKIFYGKGYSLRLQGRRVVAMLRQSPSTHRGCSKGFVRLAQFLRYSRVSLKQIAVVLKTFYGLSSSRNTLEKSASATNISIFVIAYEDILALSHQSSNRLFNSC